MKKRSAAFDFIRRRTRLEKAAAALFVLTLIVDGVNPASLLSTALHLATAACFLALLVGYLRSLFSMALWRLSNRLLVTYVFIAVVPLMLGASMVGIATYFFYGHVATYMASGEVNKLREEMGLAARAVALDLTRGETGDIASLLIAHLPRTLQTVQPQVTLLTPEELPKGTTEFEGLVLNADGLDLRTVTRCGDRYLSVSVGLERALAAWLANSFGNVSLTRNAGIAREFKLEQAQPLHRAALPPKANFTDFEVSWIFEEPVMNWETREASSGYLVVHTRPSLVNAQLFSHLGEYSRVPLTALAVIGGLFLLIELGSLLVGIGLTRSITGAVNDLYEGTQRVNRGDFSYRIPVRSRDQLSALAGSFNDMTVSLERLIRESKEKERLQSELEIASEVQRQLFPKELPRMPGLEMAGVCRPARVVSGDYYDYVAFDETRLALAIGDIAGKGISAALVMAGIQSALHAQLFHWRGRAAGGSGADAVSVGVSPERLVAQLNRQLYDSTSASTFATFVYAVYDDTDGRLTYSNAGHLPPLVVGRDGTRRLDRGGIVLGIIPGAVYEQETVMLHRGDLMIAFTDGITEPENSYGGEFGEERLLEVVAQVRDRPPMEVAQAILQAVDEWSDSPEAHDDMTLLVARRL